jgi:hypothetical protein
MYSLETIRSMNARAVRGKKDAFQRYIKNPANWRGIVPYKVDPVFLKTIPHLIDGAGDAWKSDLIFIGNAEFDSLDGHQISGDPLEKIIGVALERAPRYILLIDQFYEFAVSIGVYVGRKSRKEV